jgi:tetratricopeptide (TPR) repeat protein
VQWGDLPSLTFVDAALRNLADRPLFVLVTARPEVSERFPKLLAGRPLTELKLAGLTKKASERLVRGVLGPRADSPTVDRIVQQASGDAFYLEELIRSVADGGGSELPQTVLASVQARLDRLAPSVRRVLRAASVYGDAFDLDGAVALLGETTDARDVRAALDDLVDRELLQAVPGAGPGGRDALAFRQELVREAAYAMLTDGDRALGHRLAGDHLERVGEGEPAALAHHFDRGGEPARAVNWYERAAEQALVGNDLAATLRWCDRASACAQKAGVPEALGAVLLLAAEAHRWRGEFAPAEEAASAAMELLPKRCSAWFVAAGEVAILCGRLGKNDTLMRIGGELVRAWAGDVSPPDQVVATARAAAILVQSGAYELADQLVERVRTFAASPDPVVVARVHQAIATRALIAGDPGTHLTCMLVAAARFVEAGDERNACNARVTVGFAEMDMGAYEPAEVALREALALAERLGLPNLAAYAKHNLGLVLARTRRLDEAAKVESEAMIGFAQQGDRRLAGASRAYLGMILAEAGRLEEADAELERAVSELGISPSVQVYALATLVMVRLRAERNEEALVDARRAMALFEQLGGIEEGEALVRLVYAEALQVSGDTGGARLAITTARARLLERAEKLRDPAFRTSFLERVPDHARTLALAKAWNGER